jgi:hypothetical protein
MEIIDEQNRAKLITIASTIDGLTTEDVMNQHLKLTAFGKKIGWYMRDHHGDGRLQLNARAMPGVALQLVQQNPIHFHSPAYVAHRGWFGVWLDLDDSPWDEIEDLLRVAAESVRPKGRARRTAGNEP